MGAGARHGLPESMSGTVGGSAARREGVGIDDIRFVEAKRSEFPRISWQALANMRDRNVHDLRMKCDPEYRRAQAGGVSPPPTPRPAPRPPVATVPAPPPAQTRREAALRTGRLRQVAFGLGVETSLTPGTLIAAVMLALRNGPGRSRDVAGAVNRKIEDVSGALAKLTLRGLLSRRAPERSRYGYVYALTEAGRREADALAEVMARANA